MMFTEKNDMEIKTRQCHIVEQNIKLGTENAENKNSKTCSDFLMAK